MNHPFRSASLCTLSAALALACGLAPTASFGASPCKGLDEAACTAHKACRWQPAREGAMNKSPRRAYCRLDMAKVNDILKGLDR